MKIPSVVVSTYTTRREIVISGHDASKLIVSKLLNLGKPKQIEHIDFRPIEHPGVTTGVAFSIPEIIGNGSRSLARSLRTWDIRNIMRISSYMIYPKS